MPHNIEKSKFHPDEYVGYAAGAVWSIGRPQHGFGWVASTMLDGRLHQRGASTLEGMAEELRTFEKKFKKN